MSETESFESIVNAAMEKVHGNYEIKAIEVAGILGTLSGAHDREIAQARDPQRLRGTKPDTFDGAIEALREFRWQHATNDEDAIPYINAVKEMHDREIRDVSQQQYDRGFNDGEHSMDAEHRAVAMRLRALPLDGGSHENLSQIARAVYHSDFGWTQGACMSLRDELVRLMGGVSDDTAEPMTTDELIEYINQDTRRLKGDATKAGDDSDTCDSQCCGACADSDGRDSGEQEVTDERFADDCAADSRGGGCGGDLHLAGMRITDELREFVGTFSKRLSISVAEVNAIADRIDEQFDRICQQQEDVLQSTIAELVEQRDELQAKLDSAEDAMNRAAGRWAKADAECHELQAKLDEYDRTHVELPMDANGEVFRLGCTVRMVDRHPEVLLTVHSITLCDDGEWLLYARDDKSEYSCNLSASEFEMYDMPRDTAESIVRDLSMGTVTESEAIERIGKLNG